MDTHQEVAAIAYRLWQERGCPEGDPETDWFHAVVEFSVSEVHAMVERVLRGEASRIQHAGYTLRELVEASMPPDDDVKAVEVENPEVIEGTGVLVKGEVMERKPKPETFVESVKKGAKKFMEDTERVWKKN